MDIDTETKKDTSVNVEEKENISPSPNKESMDIDDKENNGNSNILRRRRNNNRRHVNKTIALKENINTNNENAQPKYKKVKNISKKLDPIETPIPRLTKGKNLQFKLSRKDTEYRNGWIQDINHENGTLQIKYKPNPESKKYKNFWIKKTSKKLKFTSNRTRSRVYG